jgi:hypothetical protein
MMRLRTVCLETGQRKGLRLVSKKSLDDFIRSFLPGGSRFGKSRNAEVIGERVDNAATQPVSADQ